MAKHASVRTVSFGRYASWLAAITALIYLGFAGLSYHQYQTARGQLEESELIAAHQELAITLSKSLNELRAGVAELKEWDELYQQLANRRYFAYWHAHRITQSGVLDRRFGNLMLYDPEGRALSHMHDLPLPEALPEMQPGLQSYEYFRAENGDVRAIFVVALRRQDDGPLLGFLAVDAMLLPTIERLHAFNLIDAQSLQFAAQPMSSRADIITAARFKLIQTRHFKLIDGLVVNVILTLGAVVLVPSLILMLLAMHFVGRAVRRVPAVIERLRQSGMADDDQAGLSESAEATRGLRLKELQAAEESLIDYHRELSSTNRALDQKNQELWVMAHQDVLTGTLNRRAFDEHWLALEAQEPADERGYRLMLCDINHFKAINDSYGHPVGDSVLVSVARCLRETLGENLPVFRLGGDEFASVLRDCDEAQAVALARRCEEAVTRYPFSDALSLSEPVRLSIGLSASTVEPGVSIKALLRQADMAMYASKRPGSPTISVFHPSMAGSSGGVFSTGVNEAVYQAIDFGRGIVMHYQPIVDIAADGAIGKPVYFEALVRLAEGDRLYLPGEIFPAIEARHLEPDMDRAIIAQIARDLDAGLVPVKSGVSINLSGPSVVNDQLLDWLEPLRKHLSRQKLVLEVTETNLITQMQAASRNLTALREMGYEIALDDFGSGYSSLRYLSSMPVDIVKFDQSLIHSLNEPDQRLLVEHLAELISGAGRQIVAEGVETEAILSMARDVGFVCFQGYLLGRPERLPAEG